MFIMNAAHELTLKHHDYKKAVKLYVGESYKQDTANGDLTSDFFLEEAKQVVHATITSSGSGLFAGLQEAEWLLEKVGIAFNPLYKEGGEIAEQSTIMTLSGPAYKILKVERTLLNLLQRMSGIATYTNAFRQKMVGDIQLLATRKTLWGLLDKRAVSVGGGGTHRLHLGDAVLIKDNHLSLTPQWPERLMQVFLEAEEARFIEIEVDLLEMAQAVLDFFRNVSSQEKNRAVVMLDNFSPEQVKVWAPAFEQAGVMVEVSGGITLENLSHYMLPGVCALSSSALTMEAHHLDMSLHLEG